MMSDIRRLALVIWVGFVLLIISGMIAFTQPGINAALIIIEIGCFSVSVLAILGGKE